MKDKVFKVYLNQKFNSREEIYSFISHEQSSVQLGINEIYEKIIQREEQGSIHIANGVLLPHFISEKLVSSTLTIIVLKKPLTSWGEKVLNVEMLIVLSINPKGSLDEQGKIRSFVERLVDEEFIKQLKHLKGEEELEELIVNER